MQLVQADAEFVGAVAADWLANRNAARFTELPEAIQRRVVHEQLIAIGAEPDFEWVEWLRANRGQPLTIAPGAAVVLSSHRLHDLAGLCDVYVFLLPHQATVLRAHEIVTVGPVTAEHLASVFDRLRGGTMLLRATS